MTGYNDLQIEAMILGADTGDGDGLINPVIDDGAPVGWGAVPVTRALPMPAEPMGPTFIGWFQGITPLPAWLSLTGIPYRPARSSRTASAPE